jgi:NAD(P)-dependent dehydrogenase (short-subunit alcohol dehydrogenase family)
VNSSLGLDGKVALVTGGTRGIGRAIAQAFLELGARVMITGQSEASIAPAATQLAAAEGCAAAYQVDFIEPGAPARAVRAVVERFGGIDILVNNAGVLGPMDPWELDEAQWDRVQAINLRAPFFCARDAARAMKAAGRGGAIVNLSSVGGQLGGVATGTPCATICSA